LAALHGPPVISTNGEFNLFYEIQAFKLLDQLIGLLTWKKTRSDVLKNEPKQTCGFNYNIFKQITKNPVLFNF